jgi:hypothetical protein
MTKACTVCDDTRWLQESHGAGGLNDVCLPCFFLWYDGVPPRVDPESGKYRVLGEDILAARREAQKNRTYPFEPGGQFDETREAA